MGPNCFRDSGVLQGIDAIFIKKGKQYSWLIQSHSFKLIIYFRVVFAEMFVKQHRFQKRFCVTTTAFKLFPPSLQFVRRREWSTSFYGHGKLADLIPPSYVRGKHYPSRMYTRIKCDLSGKQITRLLKRSFPKTAVFVWNKVCDDDAGWARRTCAITAIIISTWNRRSDCGIN